MSFLIASTVSEAVEAMAGGALPIAGGTDLVVGARQGKLDLPPSLVAIDRLSSLAEIDESETELRIGALVSHARLMTAPVIVDGYSGLADGAALVGSPATRAVGTIGGNVMNGSPAMDTGAPLAVLDASVELRSTTGTRLVPVAELWTGPGTTSADETELCTAVVLPRRPRGSASAYVRLEYRRAMEIAIVGAAAAVALDSDGAVAEVRVALTAVAPTILSVTGLEDLAGRPVDDATLEAVAERASTQAAPISDLRAGERYRSHTVGVMAKRAVAAAAGRGIGQDIAVPVNRSVGIGATL
jgi:CO/xanthine dehydrogenase FAD-binding subunit